MTQPLQAPLPRTARPPLRRTASIFSALGDRTRLSLVSKLTGGEPLSIARLTQGEASSRQAITKHLAVLRRAGIIRSVRHGREHRFALQPQALHNARQCLDLISRQWDDALSRLKAMVEGHTAPTPNT